MIDTLINWFEDNLASSAPWYRRVIAGTIGLVLVCVMAAIANLILDATGTNVPW